MASALLCVCAKPPTAKRRQGYRLRGERTTARRDEEQTSAERARARHGDRRARRAMGLGRTPAIHQARCWGSLGDAGQARPVRPMPRKRPVPYRCQRNGAVCCVLGSERGPCHDAIRDSGALGKSLT
uniref:OSJNBa0089K21.13 protein n=2 Tax=Oryza TaxID=4527 RepID=Q7XQM3_ORYSJ|nr:OSJNBb0022F23.1 [Oryza sativa Japonica Group]CAE03059.2 OSJNBa0089K21.13 [Oryza sativa Japonica Group]